jgi:hypothetical protein
MKVAIALLFLTASAVHAQTSPLSVDASLPIPPLKMDAAGELILEASPTSAATDFDYLVGKWKLKNKKLECRLNGCTDWSAEFESYVEMQKILGGLGNTDQYFENVSGKPFRGFALRLFDPTTRLWSIYWVDGNRGTLDPPVVGSFTRGVGHFFGKDTYKGRPILVVFRWDVRNPELPVWSQAFSVDQGKTWEWNSINVSERIF